MVVAPERAFPTPGRPGVVGFASTSRAGSRIIGLDDIAPGNPFAACDGSVGCAVCCIQVYRGFPQAKFCVVLFDAMMSKMPSCTETIGFGL